MRMMRLAAGRGVSSPWGRRAEVGVPAGGGAGSERVTLTARSL